MRQINHILLIAVTLTMLVGCNNKGDHKKMNTIFIFANDLGKEWTSTYGAEEIETPNIDKLAGNGLKFENFYAMPQCTPSRVILFTGQYPFRHGWVNHWDAPRWGGGAHFDPDYQEIQAKLYNQLIDLQKEMDDPIDLVDYLTLIL